VPAPLPFDAVLFDCDGVLVDSEPITNEVLRTMLGELGWDLSPQECWARFVGRALHDELGVIAARTGVAVGDAWIAEFRERRNVALERDLVAVPGAGDALAAVAAAYPGRVACASGADRAKIELQLTKTGLREPFGPHVHSGMETPRSKPAPDVYLAAAAGLGVDPARCAVVEDTVAGVTAGVAAGATVLGYVPLGLDDPGAEALRTAGAHHLFTSMSDLPALLRAV
jgi:beta-phosphoglucomutase-like phosphatase (HAD superfamily)